MIDPKNDERAVLLDASLNHQVEVEAQLAVQEISDKVRERGGELTPALIKEAIETRIKKFLGPGAKTPIVRVERDADGELSIDIRPAHRPLIITRENASDFDRGPEFVCERCEKPANVRIVDGKKKVDKCSCGHDRWRRVG